MRDDFSNEHFSGTEWLSYLDSDPGAGTGNGMRTHVENCPECRGFAASIGAVRSILCEQAEQLREATALSDEAIDSMLISCFSRLRSTASAEAHAKWSASEAIVLLRVLVEPICGRGTAGATIDLALRRSTASDECSVTEGNWSLFITNFSDLMASVCGSAAGRLVNRAGFCLAVARG
jgi:predicted anti-sigma-YlaC factor YlaD